MFLKLLPNFMLLSNTEMFLFLISFVFATAAGVTAFLLFSLGTIPNLTNCFRTKQLPIVMPDGSVVTSKEDLECHLQVLEKKLLDKANELETSKTKVNDTKESIEKLADTQTQVKKYYATLKQEIKKSEDDFNKLQNQIDDYRGRRMELEQEMKRNEEYYNNLLKSVAKNPEHEVLEKTNAELEFSPDKLKKKMVVKFQGYFNPPKNAEQEPLTSSIKTPLNILSKFNMCKLRNENEQNMENKTSGGFGKPQNIQQLKNRFSSPVGVCSCGSILCAGNCPIAKNLKLDINSQHQFMQSIAPQCAEVSGKSLWNKVNKIDDDVKGKLFPTKVSFR